MTPGGELALRVAREGLYLVLLARAPAVLAALAVALVVAVLQTATQVQEQTLSFVPKLVAVAVALAVAGPWLGGPIPAFARATFERLPHL
jgi:flagellar biosynthetic protein FliQ